MAKILLVEDEVNIASFIERGIAGIRAYGFCSL